MSTNPVKATMPTPGTVAHIGNSVLVKGELSGSEDLYLDGEVEGSIELRDFTLTVGPHGRVRANIHAKNVIVQGKVEGDVSVDQRVELRSSSLVVGDIRAQRIIIEEGAVFKGKLDTAEKAGSTHSVTRSATVPAASQPNAVTSSPSVQASLLDKA